MLYIVATPIGNLQDISPRAIEALRGADLIVAEDTRHSKKLLAHFDITTPLQSFHDHSGGKRVEDIVGRLREGKTIALISDAGTPAISDPGYELARQSHAEDITVIPLPGACAAIAALSASGLPSDRFSFEGFLPAKRGARRQILEARATHSATMVFYEAPHRILDCLEDMVEILGAERQCCIAREITKQFETIRTASLQELQAFVSQDSNQQKGEFVIIVSGVKVDREVDEEADRILDILLQELSVKQSASLAAKITGKHKRELYNLAVNKNANASDDDNE